MNFIPEAPTTRIRPTKVAPDTYVIHEVQHALGQPLSVYLNSLVIRGAQPVIVDTGTIRNRAQWLEDVFSLVDPEDVRWVFISHDDADHTGNLAEVLERCPRAQLVSSWAINERHANAFAFPLDRCRWINDGDCFDIGDRKLIAVRPPTYDSPATRGLFDPRTGVYWAVDCFATPIPGDATVSTFATDVGDLDPDFWWHGTTMFVLNALSPWVKLVDRDKFAATVARVRDLQPQTIVAAHSPVITGPSIERALSQTLNLVDVELPPIPDDSALQHLLAAIQPGPLPEAVNGAVSTAALRDGVPQLR